jgi:hypothetical protein
MTIATRTPMADDYALPEKKTKQATEKNTRQ